MLKVAQANLQHKKSASYHFYRKLVRENYSVALIQEPYLYKGKLVGVNRNVWSIYSANDNSNPLAVIIVKKNLVSFLEIEYSTTYTIIISLKIADNQIDSMYLCSSSMYPVE